MNRRSILKAALGIAATPTAVSVRTAASALGVGTALAAGSESTPVSVGSGGVVATPLKTRPVWQVVDRARDHARRMSMPERHLPPHIAAMRSWSPVYKASVFAREQAIMDEYFKKVLEDRTFAETIFESLGLSLPPEDDNACGGGGL